MAKALTLHKSYLMHSQRQYFKATPRFIVISAHDNVLELTLKRKDPGITFRIPNPVWFSVMLNGILDQITSQPDTWVSINSFIGDVDIDIKYDPDDEERNVMITLNELHEGEDLDDDDFKDREVTMLFSLKDIRQIAREINNALAPKTVN